MPLEVDGQTMYSTREACRMAGTNVNTYFRWIRQGKFPDVEFRDRNNWRLFTTGDIRRLEARVKRVTRVKVDIQGRPMNIELSGTRDRRDCTDGRLMLEEVLGESDL